MPVIATQLITNGNTADQTSYTTASVTPTAGKLQLLAVSSFKTGATPAAPSITGNSLTWTQVATAVTTTGDNGRITLFRATGSPTVGTIAIDFSGVTQANCFWSLNEFSFVNLSGTNGANAIVQSATAFANSGSAGPVVTLAAFGSALNATFGAVWKNATNAVTPGTGFTELGEVEITEGGIQTQWRNDNDTSVDWSFVGSGGDLTVAVAAELKFAPATGGGFFNLIV